MPDSIIEYLASRLSFDKRMLLGITGPPGAGKSTVAQRIVNQINADFPERAIVVPMDGYHYSNEKLQEMGLLELKGVPETFDAAGFTRLLQRLKNEAESTIRAPLFDRSIEASINDAIAIEPRHKLCVVEGNYLLLQVGEWAKCRELLDEVWYIEAPAETIEPRLLERHIKGGRTPEGARIKMDSTDLPNARLIEATKARADRIITL